MSDFRTSTTATERPTWVLAQWIFSAELDLRDELTIGQKDGRTGRCQESNLVHFRLTVKCDIWWQYFNDVTDNKLTKFCVFIGWSRIFIPPLKFLRSIALRSTPIGWTPLTVKRDKKRGNGVRSNPGTYISEHGHHHDHHHRTLY